MSLHSGSHLFKAGGPYTLRSGEVLNELELAYEVHGKPAANGSNIVLIHHALSPSHHVTRFDADDQKGWWEPMVGADKPIDTNKYCVICINNLGSCYGSTGPNDDRFPEITIQDIVDTQVLLLDTLGVSLPITVIGNSMGAMLSLQMAIDYPDRVKYLVSACSAYKAYASNVINRSIQKRILQFDLSRWRTVDDGSQLAGFTLARELAYYTYRNPSNLIEKFPEHQKNAGEISEVESYFTHNANKFTRKFNPYSFLYSLNAMDLFDVTRGYEDLLEPFKKIQATVLVISVNSDILFTPVQQQELFEKLQAAGVESKLIRHPSTFGHDAFLVDIEDFGCYIREFIS